MSVFNTKTHLGAFLHQMAHFCPNDLIGFVEISVLTGYGDASGKYTNPTDRVLTVNGCLSTPERWQNFDKEWQAYLKSENFKPDKRTGRYVFHTADFHTGNCEWMPENLKQSTKETRFAKEHIYNQLVFLIRKHTLYRFGYGIFLDDFRRLENDFLFVREHFFQQPGNYVSKLCFYHNSNWAENNGFSPTVNYVFDHGDEFWGELSNTVREEYHEEKNTPDIYFTVGSLTSCDKRLFSPLQAADILAWECRNHYLDLSPDEIENETPVRPSEELGRINEKGKANFLGYNYQHLVNDIREVAKEEAEKKNIDLSQFTDKTFEENLDDLARMVFARNQKEAEARKQELLDEWREKKKRKANETQKRDGKIQ